MKVSSRATSKRLTYRSDGTTADVLSRPLVAEDVAQAVVFVLQQPEKISIKALDVVPSAQRSLTVFDREWSSRHKSS